MRGRNVRGLARSGIAAAALAAVAALAVPAPAHADGVTTGSPVAGGYTVSAKVTFSGPAAPGGGGTRTMGVPAKCWWEPYTQDGLPDPSDPVAVKEWWLRTMPTINGTFAPARLGYGRPEMYDAAIKAAAAGQKLTYYHAVCREGMYDPDFNNGREDAPPDWTVPGGPPGIPVSFAFFPTGDPPAPVVDPADLARVAYDAMEFTEPQLQRNPRIGGAVAATLVRLPTWFWVTDPTSVGPGGTRWIQAQVGAVWSRVDATTQRLSIGSTSGDRGACTPAQAVVAYGPGVAEGGACTLAFTRSSATTPGGFTVTSRVDWNATWTSSTGDAGGGLVGRFAQSQVQVPVAESQAVVDDVG